MFHFMIQSLGSILLLFSNNCFPPISILGSKVGVNRTDSLGTATVVFCILSGWYSSTRQRGSSTVALDIDHHTSAGIVDYRYYAYGRSLRLIIQELSSYRGHSCSTHMNNIVIGSYVHLGSVLAWHIHQLLSSFFNCQKIFTAIFIDR